MAIARVIPQLRTLDLDATIRFYTEKAGFEVDFHYSDFYAGLSAGSSRIHLKRVDSPDPSIPYVDEGGHIHLYLEVDDVDAYAERLRAAGVKLVQAPCDTDWGTRELIFHDDQGHTIYAGMAVKTA